MASKNLYTEYNQDALKHFNLEDETYYGLVTTGKEIADVFITQDVTKFKNIRNLLSDTTLSNTKIKDQKRGFVLSRCPVTLDGKTVYTRYVGEQHVKEDCNNYIPSAKEWIVHMNKNEKPDWMRKTLKIED